MRVNSCFIYGKVGWAFLGLQPPRYSSYNGVGNGARGLVMRGDRFGEIPWRERARGGTFSRDSKLVATRETEREAGSRSAVCSNM